MTKEERNKKILRAIEEYTEKHSVSPEKAKEALVKAGIYDENGKLI
jgi:hypothetical protein